jgi:site-specific recombinase XerC
MIENKQIPSLITFYFGDSATHAQRAASRRLRKWSRAFEDWIEQRKLEYQKDTVKHILLAWRRLARQSTKLPWQLTSADIDQHVLWLRQEGFAESTINGSLGFISGFFQWVDQNHLDSACPPDFNPAKSAVRLSLPLYNDVDMWNLAEVQALLDLLGRDDSVLGRRDYAFFLARLNTGVPLKHLQHLEWGQIEQRESGAWVKWRPGGLWVQLPGLVWQAVDDYLQASGRLDGMSTAKFIFTPQVQPVLQGSGTRAEDWLEGHPLSSSALLRILKLYGRQVGITESRLNFTALRRTAIRLRLDQGESLEGMQSFMDTRELPKCTRFRLARLPELSLENTLDPAKRDRDLSVPLRVSKPLIGDEGTTHGFFSSRQNIQAVRAIMAENIQGMDQEIACLRQLMKGLLEREGDDLHQVEAYSQAARRLGELLPANEEKGREKQDTWAEEFLSKLDELSIRQGQPIVSPQIRQNALRFSPGLMGATGRIVEEAATLRLMLRNVYRHALLQVGRREYVHLVDLYGLGCVRLSRLLKIGGGDEKGRLDNYLHAMIDEAIRELTREWHLDGGD